MALLQLQQLDKYFTSGTDRLQVLHQLDLTVKEGEIATIVGQSGCGKSTLLHLIGGMDSASGGKILFQGRDVCRMKEGELTLHRQNSISMIFQMHYLLEELTAVENVMLPAVIKGERRASATHRAHGLLQRVGLASRCNHYPSQLSGGESQRVTVARALINNPKLVLADEPTGSLDEKNSKVVEELLFNLMRDSHVAMMLVTHDVQLASRGDRRYLLHQGQLQPC